MCQRDQFSAGAPNRPITLALCVSASSINVKQRTSPVGQYIIEGLGDTENAYDYVDELVPLIGEVVLYFNSLESNLDSCLCSFISDRTDQQGLIVLHNMGYQTKVDLYARFTNEHLRMMNWEVEVHDQLLSALGECGALRNRVVHANWGYTDEEGYTQVRIKHTKQGFEHELWQFSIEAMGEILRKISDTIGLLEKFEERCEELMCEWNQEVAVRRQTERNENDA